MIHLKINEEELNTILQGLYLLEDQSWFYGKDKTDKLIKKLNCIEKSYKGASEVLCDI